MALYRYFKLSKDSVEYHPDPNGPLSDSICPMAIKDANEAMKVIATTKSSKSRGTYCKISTENQAAIAK